MTPRTTRPVAGDDIAIIGLGCLYPGAPDVATFWQNIVGKVSAIGNPPPEAWDEAVYYERGSDHNDRVYCRKGGYLGPLAYFDPLEHGVMPRAVEGGEPDQWLALRVARDALRDSGYAEGFPNGERAALILGKGNYANRGTFSAAYHGQIVDQTIRLLESVLPGLTSVEREAIRGDLKRTLPRFDSETAPSLISNVTVGRIANRLDLKGPSYTVDAACASSLVAVDIAVKGLRHGEYDLALVGGMQVATPVPVLSLFCQLKALSLGEHIRPFDKGADGTMLSEGVGMAVLKRRADAERDGDRIYAVLKAAGVASDGRAVSVLAPRVEGEELALRRAYTDGGIDPRSVSLIEAHGTATLVGDAVEIEALSRVFGRGGEGPFCAIGSVKSMIGHTMPAAGIAGLIKVALSLYHKVLPPTLGVTEPSPRLQLETTPFYINTETRPWVHGSTTTPRRGGVNAFGFGGINAHIVLEEVPESAAYREHEIDFDSEVCLFGGPAREAVIAAARQALAAMAQVPTLRLADLASTLNARFHALASAEVVLGVVAESPADLAHKLERAVAKLADPACKRIKDVSGIYYFSEPLGRQGRLAFLFPGEGAQYVNMLADLCRHFPEVREGFEDVERQLGGTAGARLTRAVFPPPAFTAAEAQQHEARLWQMDVAVGAVCTGNLAVYRLLQSLRIVPDAVLGHSTGEYAAMHAAGLIADWGYAAKELNRIFGTLDGAAGLPQAARLFAVGAGREKIDAICQRFGTGVIAAMDNCRHQVVIVARHDLAQPVEAELRHQGFLFEVLPFDRPYHTPLFEPFALELRDFLDRLITRPPQVPLYSATDVGLFPSDTDAARDTAYRHWIQPVEFRRTVERMHDDGIRLFVEAGPRGNLTAFVDDILGRRPYAAIPANTSRRTGLTQIHHLVAQLAAHAVPLSTARLYERRDLRTVDLDAPHDPRQVTRPIGRVKIPTGAPSMRLTPETIDMLRARQAVAVASPSALPAVPATPVVTTTAAAEVREAPATAAPEPPVARPLPPVPGTPVDTVTTAPAATATSSTTAVASSPAVVDQVMAEYLATMDRFLGLQEDLLAGTAAAPLPPLLEAVSEHEPGTSVTGRAVLDITRVPCLRDHTLGRDVSAADPDLPGFPVVPFTMLLEVMAETASLLRPGEVLTEVRGMRLQRWVAAQRGPAVVEARAVAEADAIRVTLADVGEDGTHAVAHASLVFAPAYPDAPLGDPYVAAQPATYRWPEGHLYDEAMFHGPAFRGVVSVDEVDGGGASATLTTLDRSQLLASADASGLITDFVLLDQPGQVVGFWASHVFDRAYLVLPFHMERLSLYGPLLPPGERLQCAARVAAIGDQRVRASLDVLRGDGRLWARFEGWEDRRFDVPAAALRLMASPQAVFLSRPFGVPVDLGVPGPVVGRRIGPDELPADWLQAHGGLWAGVLAMIVLGRGERAQWHAMAATDRRRTQWLLGRIAAKDAVRDWLRQTAGLDLRPADLEIVPDAHGRPEVRCAWLAGLPEQPLVSISHVDAVAVAVVTAGPGLAGLGVDIDRAERLQPAVAELAFSADERRLVDAFPAEDRQAWLARMWCAKEACAKALGRGFAPGVRSFTVRAIARDGGALQVQHQPAGEPVRDLLAWTAGDGEWAVATCATMTTEDVTT